MDTGIFDFLNRQQVYIEGVKNWFGRDFGRYLKLLKDAITEFLNKAGVKRLGDLPKAKFTALLKRVDKRVNEVMSNYGSEFLAEMRRFVRIDLTLQRGAYSFVRPEIDLSGVSLSSVWSAAKDRIIPALGATAKDSVVTLVNSARDKIRVRINTGYVDNEPVGDTVAAVTNLDRDGEPSTLKTIWNTARSVVSTALQHGAATASDFVGKLVHDCYQWCSVLDSRTSPICRERNGAVYRYGAGPMPPAHPNCRSRAVPVDCGSGLENVPTYGAWLLQQSQSFLTDAFSSGFAKKVADGKATQSDIPDIADYPPLSLDEFELKAKQLTA